MINLDILKYTRQETHKEEYVIFINETYILFHRRIR